MKSKNLISLELFVEHQNSHDLPVLFFYQKILIAKLYAKLILANMERGYSCIVFARYGSSNYNDICALTAEVETDFVQLHLLKNRFNHKASAWCLHKQ